MTLITIDTADPRDVKALQLAAAAEGWSRLTDDWYRMPSQDGRHVYDVAAHYCSCEDHRQGNRCKHMRALAIHRALRRTETPLPQTSALGANNDGLSRILGKRPPLYETDHRRPMCMLYDAHYGPCSPVDPNPGEPIVGVLPEPRCGKPIMSAAAEEAAFWRRFED